MSLAFGNCFSSSGVSSRDMTHLPPNAIKLHLVWLKAINLGMTIKTNIDAEDHVFPIDFLSPDEDNFSGDAAAQYAGANAHPYLSYHAALGLLLKSKTCFFIQAIVTKPQEIQNVSAIVSQPVLLMKFMRQEKADMLT